MFSEWKSDGTNRIPQTHCDITMVGDIVIGSPCDVTMALVMLPYYYYYYYSSDVVHWTHNISRHKHNDQTLPMYFGTIKYPYTKTNPSISLN